MIITRGDSGIAMTSTEKRPMIGQSYLRQLLRQRPYDALHFYSRFTGNDSLSFYQGSQDCAKIDAIMSHSCCLMTNDIVTGADQLRAGNGIKAHSNDTSRAPLCAHRNVHFQVKGARTEINWHGGACVPCSDVSVLSKNSANKVSRDPDNGRSTLRVDKKD